MSIGDTPGTDCLPQSKFLGRYRGLEFLPAQSPRPVDVCPIARGPTTGRVSRWEAIVICYRRAAGIHLTDRYLCVLPLIRWPTAAPLRAQPLAESSGDSGLLSPSPFGVFGLTAAGAGSELTATVGSLPHPASWFVSPLCSSSRSYRRRR